jgi:dihydrofolate synthase/folylpolyglutamate synthase
VPIPRSVETYEEAIGVLYGRINYERALPDRISARDFKLDRMQQFLERLGNPHICIPAVHIAGTKGKGSTAVMIAEVLSAAGYRTGLFTSPHVSAFEERMRVNGTMPDPSELVRLINCMLPIIRELDSAPGCMSPTYFELATAMAWLYFVERGVDVAVMEVGLGGRLDSTNLCRPIVTAITNISLDHTAVLGNSLEAIAREKAGIIKPGIPVVSSVQQGESRNVIEETCRARRAPLWQLGQEFQYRLVSSQSSACAAANHPDLAPCLVDVTTPHRKWPLLSVPLPGEHQAVNASLALSTLDVLDAQDIPVSFDAAIQGLAEVRWPLRIEVLQNNPLAIVDSAHNDASVSALLKTLRSRDSAGKQILVFATSRDKDAAALLQQLVPEFDEIIVTRYQSNPRSVPAEDLARIAKACGRKPVHVCENAADAWTLARRMASPADTICVTGSLFIAGEVRELLTTGNDSAAEEIRDPANPIAIPKPLTIPK